MINGQLGAGRGGGAPDALDGGVLAAVERIDEHRHLDAAAGAAAPGEAARQLGEQLLAPVLGVVAVVVGQGKEVHEADGAEVAGGAAQATAERQRGVAGVTGELLQTDSAQPGERSAGGAVHHPVGETARGGEDAPVRSLGLRLAQEVLVAKQELGLAIELPGEGAGEVAKAAAVEEARPGAAARRRRRVRPSVCATLVLSGPARPRPELYRAGGDLCAQDLCDVGERELAGEARALELAGVAGRPRQEVFEQGVEERQVAVAAVEAEALLSVSVPDAPEVVRQRQGVAVLSARYGAPLAHRGEKVRRPDTVLGDGVGAGDEEAAVVVRAPDHRLQPGGRSLRLDAVLGGQPLHRLRSERAQQPDDGLVVALGARSVARLENVEQEEELLDGVAVEAPVEIEQRVGDEVDDALRAQQTNELIDVLSRRQQVWELPLRDAEGDDVQTAAGLGQRGAQLGAQEGPRAGARSRAPLRSNCGR